jgi:hypothetical protein
MARLVSSFASSLEKKQREATDLAKTVTPGNGRLIMNVILGVICATAWVAPYPTFGGAAPDPVREARDAQVVVTLAAGQIMQFRQEHGRFPTSLVEVGIEDSLLFVPGQTGEFVLKAQGKAPDVLYDSSAPERPVLLGNDSLYVRANP